MAEYDGRLFLLRLCRLTNCGSWGGKSFEDDNVVADGAIASGAVQSPNHASSQDLGLTSSMLCGMMRSRKGAILIAAVFLYAQRGDICTLVSSRTARLGPIGRCVRPLHATAAFSGQHSQAALWHSSRVHLAVVLSLDHIRAVFGAARDDHVWPGRLLLARHDEIDDFAQLVERLAGPLVRVSQCSWLYAEEMGTTGGTDFGRVGVLANARAVTSLCILREGCVRLSKRLEASLIARKGTSTSSSSEELPSSGLVRPRDVDMFLLLLMWK